MRIHANREEFKPRWIRSLVLASRWTVGSSYFVASWEGSPLDGWFCYDNNANRTAFKTADMYLERSGESLEIRFVDGRHRTRWLLSLGITLVPVGLEDAHYTQALHIGLAAASVRETDEIVF